MGDKQSISRPGMGKAKKPVERVLDRRIYALAEYSCSVAGDEAARNRLM